MRNVLAQLVDEAWSELQKVDRPIKITLKPGVDVTPEVQAYIDSLEQLLSVEAKNRNSDLNLKIQDEIFRRSMGIDALEQSSFISPFAMKMMACDPMISEASSTPTGESSQKS